jgi:hypothetical protein
MQRKHRLAEKMPYQAIMPIVGKLERENYLSIKMKTNGQLLIYRDYEKNIVPEGQIPMKALSKGSHDNDEVLGDMGENNTDFADSQDTGTATTALHSNENGTDDENETDVVKVADGTDTTKFTISHPMSNGLIIPPYSIRPKFSKELKPKVRKVKKKKKKKKLRTDPVMDPVELPPNTIRTTRGPRFITHISQLPSTFTATNNNNNTNNNNMTTTTTTATTTTITSPASHSAPLQQQQSST